jgi:hypothetical protein
LLYEADHLPHIVLQFVFYGCTAYKNEIILYYF